MRGAVSYHVNEILKGSATADAEICRYADAHNCIVITKDSDFKNSYLLRNTPKKLIRICLGNISNDKVIELISNNLSLINQIYQDESFYLEIQADRVLLFP